MKNNIKFNNSNILYTFSNVNGKYIVELTYNFINQYQLQNTSIKISSKSKNAISSIDVRKLNIYTSINLNLHMFKMINPYLSIYIHLL